MKLRELVPYAVGNLLISFYDTIHNLHFSNYPKSETFLYFFGDDKIGGHLEFLKISILGVSLSISLAFSLVRVNEKLQNFINSVKLKLRLINYPAISGFYFHLALSLILSTYYILIKVFDHLSFTSPAINYGIFNQVIYLLSRFQPPRSSITLVTNLFFDHQHFSLFLISPLFWLDKGLNGLSLIIIVPLILITIPSILIFFSAKVILKKFNIISHNHFWIVSFSSFLLWLHPFTQSAVNFYFHEKYLMPTAFCLSLFLLIKFLFEDKNEHINLILASLALIAWLGTKEDQWIFIIAYLIQAAFWITLFRNRFVKKYRKFIIFIISNIIVSLSYSFIFIPQVMGNNRNLDYLGFYSHAKFALKVFLKDKNFLELLANLNIFGGNESYLYQNFSFFDLPGILLFPINIFGNYAERILGGGALVSPIFQYGVDVPIYSTVGVIFLYMVLYIKFNKKVKSLFIGSTILIYLLGFGAINGWNKVFYIVPQEFFTSYSGFKEASKEREDFNQIISLIPDNASLVSSSAYSTHLFARKDISFWPRSATVTTANLRPPYYIEDEYNFDYWLLPKTDIYKKQISELQGRGYYIIGENNSQVLLKKL